MSIRNIQLRHLRYYLAVAEESSYRKAAARLHLSQPPLTRQIHQLEQELGVELFVRRKRGIELTQAGRSFFEDATNILTLTEQAVERARLAAQGKIGRLDIAMFGSAILAPLPELIWHFRQQYPEVEIVLHTMDRESQLRALRERRLAIGFNRFFSEEAELQWEIVHQDAVVLAVHKSSPLAQRKQVTLDQLENVPLVLYPRRARDGRGFNERNRRMFHDAGVELDVVQEVEDVVSAVSLVSSGLWCSLVTESASILRLPNVRFVRLQPTETIDLCMIHRRDDDSILLRNFKEVIMRCPKTSPPSSNWPS